MAAGTVSHLIASSEHMSMIGWLSLPDSFIQLAALRSPKEQKGQSKLYPTVLESPLGTFLCG